MTNGRHDAAAATEATTMTADSSYTQLNTAAAAAPGPGAHLGCNGTCSGGGPISRDTSMSTQVVVLSPATPTEAAAVDEEGKGQITNSLRLAFAPS